MLVPFSVLNSRIVFDVNSGRRIVSPRFPVKESIDSPTVHRTPNFPPNAILAMDRNGRGGKRSGRSASIPALFQAARQRNPALTGFGNYDTFEVVFHVEAEG
jgi:hypothetical protein